MNASISKERGIISPPPVQDYSGRLGPIKYNQLIAKLGLGAQKRLANAATFLPAIRHFEQEFGNLSDQDLISQVNALRGRARAGDMSRDFVARGFGLCSVAVWRVLGYRAYDVQLAAGVVMFYGALCELATGEGKTLTASFPVCVRALAKKGVHVATVNDYLAKRDALEMGPVYEKLGLKCAFLQQQMEEPQRKAAYACDITYATASDFGFDFLRDRLKVRGGQVAKSHFWTPWLSQPGANVADNRVQRGHYFALVDEADSIFIDEARTPLIIASPTRDAKPEECIMYHWADGVARKLRRSEHFRLDIKKEKLELTESGRMEIRYSNPPSGPHAPAMDKLVEAVEKAVHAHYRFIKDQHYVIHDGEIVIVDESTGRPMPDRHWQQGLHQAVEAKEGVTIHLAADHAASITYQSFFRTYEKLAGMTGTVVQNAREIKRVYKLTVVPVPTNRPVIREELPDRIFPTEEAKFAAVVEDVKRFHELGRPVLIGTRAVDKSERVSELLTAAGIPHVVLNAKQDKNEAEIVSKAGQRGSVMVATNMAGRGTDIKLGPGVAELGGLHVIGTERHEAIRIDRQLKGRAGRQGDRGSAQFFLCLEDKILEALGPVRQEALIRLAHGGQRDWQQFAKLFPMAQKLLEKRHLKQRLDLMHYERQRRELLSDLGADPFVD
ncbi:MAG: preprotein translocase subunit SecA [Zavarzinella sp.]